MSKYTLNKARNKIDHIDNKIFLLIKKRTKVVKYMMRIKKHKKEIIDRKRIAVILNKIKKKSKSSKIDHKITLKIWKSMIWAYVDYQKRNFEKK